MMRPQVRVLLALFVSMALIASARAKTWIPLIADASGNFVIAEPPEEPAEDPAAAPAEKPSEKEAAQEVEQEAEEGTETPGEDADMAAESDAEKDVEAAAEPQEPEKPTPPPLSPEMAAFRDQVRRTLAQVYARSLSVQSSVPAEIIAFCNAFGHTAELSSGSRTGQKLNAVGALCWNYSCGGYRLLRSDGKQFVAQVGYGYQQRPGQLLATLAQVRVPNSYEVRVGDHHGTIADLIASEKLACREGLDESGALVALAFYTKPGETWENDLGETWSIERLLKAELDRTADPGRIDVTNRLMGISFVLQQGKKAETLSSELRERAEKHVAEFHDYTLGLQNADGSWHPGFFAYRGPSKDSAGSLYSTGAILTWLVYSLPEDRLEDERIVRGLSYLYKQLAAQTGRRSSMPSSVVAGVGQMNAARALSLYDARYFTPRTPKPPVEEAKPSEEKQAGRSANNSITSQPSSRSSTSRSGSRSSSRR